MPNIAGVDINTVLILVLGCGVLCVIGLVLVFGVQLLGSTVAAFFGLIELFTGVISGGPASWCGCLLLVAICGGLAAAAALIAVCGSNPNAMNFCLLLP